MRLNECFVFDRDIGSDMVDAVFMAYLLEQLR